MTGVLVEAVIAGVLTAAKPSLRITDGFARVVITLGWVRIAILLLMTGILLLREYKLQPCVPKSEPEERQSLLENGNGIAGSYGSVPHTPGQARRTQVSGTGWLDYFAGFRVLFPYLW